MSDKRNSKLLKNTILLYMRMVLIMIVSLYTSRVILQNLGVTDYGIYNIVGGVVALFTSLSSSMAGASNRFITFSLGKGNVEDCIKVFSTCINIHAIISFIIFILAETVGLYLFYNKLVIPIDRMNAAWWVYQYSVMTVIVLFMGLPFNSLIIAHERITVYAYISILDIVLRLVVVFCLQWSDNDRLIFYAFLLFVVQLIIQFCYQLYCSKKINECRYQYGWNQLLVKQMFGYTSWIFCGTFSVGIYTQGLNVMLNMFFGPIVNAAIGISTQVQTSVLRLSQNFQTAMRPQIVKAYANNEYNRMNKLVFSGSKMCFCLMLLIVLPLSLEINTVLECWLGDVPFNTNIFVILFLLICMLQTLNSPAVIAMQATGDIKKMQLWQFLYIAVLPLAYIALKCFAASAYIVYIIALLVEILLFVVDIRIVMTKIHVPITEYLYSVLIPIIKCIVCALPIPLAVKYYCEIGTCINFIAVVIACISSVLLSFYFVALCQEERSLVKSIYGNLVNKIKK